MDVTNNQYQNIQAKQQNTPAAGIIPAIATATALGMAKSRVASGIATYAQNAILDMPTNDLVEIAKGAEKALKSTGLTTKLVTTGLFKKDCDHIIEQALAKEAFIPIKSQLQNVGQQVKEGLNAFFAPKSNIIVTNETYKDKAFHEIGHALNKHKSAIGNVLQKVRGPMMLLAGIPTMFAIFTRQEKPTIDENGNEKMSTYGKIKNFIRDHAGGLTLLGFLPTLAEETMATVKGLKLAKANLSPALFKNISKASWLNTATYFAYAGGFALTAYCAKKVRDYFQNKSDAKVAQNNQ